MKSLENLESSYLEAARRGLAPSAAARVRVRSAALAALAANVPVPLPQPRALERLSRGALDLLDAVQSDRAKAKILVGVLGLVGVGAGGYALGLAAGRAEKQVERSVATAPSVLPVRVPVAAPAPVEPRSEESAHELAATRNRKAPERPISTAPSAPPPADPEEELRALRRVERVLRENNPRLALALLSELDRSVPGGKLLEERNAARSVALCSLDEAVSIANGRAAEFAARYPGSVYAARVNRACAVAEPNGERKETPVETDLHE